MSSDDDPYNERKRPADTWGAIGALCALVQLGLEIWQTLPGGLF